MARDILRSNNSAVIIGQRPAFSTVNRVGDQMSGALMSSVQQVTVGFSQDRQKLKQIGSKKLAVNDINRSPDVDLSIDYYYTPAMLNEHMLGLASIDDSVGATGFLSGYDNQDQNFYILTHRDQGEDAIPSTGNILGFRDEWNAKELNWEDIDEFWNVGYDVHDLFSIGNAFLTNYSLGFSVGNLPVVSTSYKASNMNFKKMETHVEVASPAINLNAGNNINACKVDLSSYSNSGYGYYTGVKRSNPPLCSPQDVNITLQNLQIGGVPISGDSHIQSFDFNVPIERNTFYGLGSNYPYGRDVVFPLKCSLGLEFLVSGFNDGNITGIIDSESTYDFDIEVVDQDEEFSNTFSFKDLKLNSSSHQMTVNNNMSYSLNFSFEINE